MAEVNEMNYDAWIENVINEHKSQLRDIKKNRKSIRDLEERVNTYENPSQNTQSKQTNGFNQSQSQSQSKTISAQADGLSFASNHSQSNQRGYFNSNNVHSFNASYASNTGFEGTVSQSQTKDNPKKLEINSLKQSMTSSYSQFEPRNHTINEMPENIVTEENEDNHSSHHKEKPKERYSDIESEIKNKEQENYEQYVELTDKNMRFDNSPTAINLRSQIENLSKENKVLKAELDEALHVNSKLKFDYKSLENEVSSIKRAFNQKEVDFTFTINELEKEKQRFEEKMANSNYSESIKAKEMELLKQKIKDLTLIVEENSNETNENLKQLESENTSLKATLTTYDKLFDILFYFFKKVTSYYRNAGFIAKNAIDTEEFTLENLDSKKLQRKLIELETFLVDIINDNNQLENKYNKILSIHSKNINNDSIDLQKTNMETVKKLNEKIYDLNEENLYLRKQIDDLVSHIKTIDKSKEEEKHEEVDIEDEYKTLENRIVELERELVSKKKTNSLSKEPKNNSSSTSSIKKPATANSLSKDRKPQVPAKSSNFTKNQRKK